MATARRLTAAEAIRSLQVDEFDNSCDEDEDTTAQSVMQATYENSDLSDCDSDELNETRTQLDKKRIFTSANKRNVWLSFCEKRFASSSYDDGRKL